MDVVRGKRRGRESDVECLHLGRGQRVARLDGRLARDRRGEPLVARGGTRHSIAGQRVERLAQTA